MKKNVQGKVNKIATLLLSSIYTSSIFADIPKMEPPSRGEGKSIMENLQNYGFDGLTLAGLAICAVAFMVVAASLISGYSDVQHGKKKWGDLGTSALIGALLVVAIIWLVTKATGIL